MLPQKYQILYLQLKLCLFFRMTVKSLIKSKNKRSIKLTINEKDIAQLEKNLHQKEYTYKDGGDDE